LIYFFEADKYKNHVLFKIMIINEEFFNDIKDEDITDSENQQ